MAAPMGRLVQIGVRFSTITTSIRQCGVKGAVSHRLHTAVCAQANRTTVDSLAKRLSNQCRITQPLNRSFSSLARLTGSHADTTSTPCNVPRSSALLQPAIRFQVQPKRTFKKYSLGKGKKKSVKAVSARFYRFNSGLWLRCRAGRNRSHWKKSKKRLQRLKQFVFCSKNQSKKLDLMVTSYWKREKNIPDDPFAPFEDRNWYGYKDFPGSHYVKHMYKKGMPVDVPYKTKSKFSAGESEV